MAAVQSAGRACGFVLRSQREVEEFAHGLFARAGLQAGFPAMQDALRDAGVDAGEPDAAVTGAQQGERFDFLLASVRLRHEYLLCGHRRVPTNQDDQKDYSTNVLV
jgi:hypothetical protein